MHYHLEIILPPTDNVAEAVGKIMAPFCKEPKNEEDASSYRFWDWYVIGGRWAGDKLQARLGREKIEAFNQALTEMRVTVSGFQAGKQELNPASQIPTVDALWRDHFPESGIDICPLFKHSNNQYDSTDLLVGDVCKLSELPKDYSAEKVIIAAFSYDGQLTAEHMEQRDFWNGCNRVETTWDGIVQSALSSWHEKHKIYRDKWLQKNTPQNDWLCVTVDYYS